MPGTIRDLRGREFGRLHVPDTAEPVIRNRHAYWPASAAAASAMSGCALLDPSPADILRTEPGLERFVRTWTNC